MASVIKRFEPVLSIGASHTAWTRCALGFGGAGSFIHGILLLWVNRASFFHSLAHLHDHHRGRAHKQEALKCTEEVRNIIPFLLTIGGAENVVYDHEGWLFLPFLSISPSLFRFILFAFLAFLETCT
ncbi:uncharacterized protein K489DRAFT_233710 [Dissoconium aciculare CBS 342.82]|uniref:Uncharacterized protein n=1 Tax=Dissoconium aciculare CBS 342.82 TaxID=1314786 RepID=A0A6J3M2A4_9PEZI|nr:uncharacterized protein K489DRAFT_233710 [Dissoconium aciculare CBS 342.82]KAF1822136.1 hypothetical protein K489DRAFT_233710 [Dissoconium aciculare CBS 342.82]